MYRLPPSAPAASAVGESQPSIMMSVVGQEIDGEVGKHDRPAQRQGRGDLAREPWARGCSPRRIEPASWRPAAGCAPVLESGFRRAPCAPPRPWRGRGRRGRRPRSGCHRGPSRRRSGRHRRSRSPAARRRRDSGRARSSDLLLAPSNISANSVSLPTGGGATRRIAGGAPPGPTASARAMTGSSVPRRWRCRRPRRKIGIFMSLQPSAMIKRSSGAWLRRHGGR